MSNDLYTTLMGNTTVSYTGFLLPVLAALFLGIVFAMAYMYRARRSRSFIATLAILPAVVCVVIMAVNGNIGAGVAVAGTFSLVRFRSAPGTAKEITAIFIAMAGGLLCGMGFLIYAAIFILIMSFVLVLYSLIGFGEEDNSRRKSLRIAVPENVDYGKEFDEVFSEYTTSHRLISAKTAGMGSVFKLSYDITLKDDSSEKALIDALRCRNGNLEIQMSIVMPRETDEL